MRQPLDVYHSLARNAAYAHRIKDVPMATALFATLWRNLDAESLSDHCAARQAFNETFARAYRSQWSPADDTPALARAVGVSAVQSVVAPRASRSSAALDCAAFYRKSAALVGDNA